MDLGILAYGGYLPRRRLPRKEIVETHAWFNPVQAGLATGERTIANWDEDSVTMAVEAARDCLAELDRQSVAGLYMASTTFPFLDRQNAGIVASALNLGSGIATLDISSSQRAGSSGLLCGLRASGGGNGPILVVAGEKRHTRAASPLELTTGDGAAALMAPVYGYIARGIWENLRQANFLDGAAPYYGVYQCLDGKWISIGPLEPQFYALLVDLLDLRPEDIGERADTARWAEQRERFAEVFRRRTRDDWCARLEGTDVCFAPVLDLEEAPNHPHNRARAIFVEAHGAVQPAPAPRFARAATPLPGPPPAPGEHNGTALPAWGFDDGEVADLRAAGVI